MPLNNMKGPLAGAWPEEHTQELTRLCEEKYSYRAIATAMNEKFGTNYTKNAVLGKAARIGLSKEAAPSVPGNRKASATRKAPYKARAPRKWVETIRIVPANGNSNAMRVIRSVSFEEAKLRCVEIVPRNVSLIDLEPNDCRYPYGELGDTTYCGHPKQDGSSYCTPHHALCYEKPRIPVYRFVGRAA
jgi:GcrA cell cycle regulator